LTGLKAPAIWLHGFAVKTFIRADYPDTFAIAILHPTLLHDRSPAVYCTTRPNCATADALEKLPQVFTPESVKYLRTFSSASSMFAVRSVVAVKRMVIDREEDG